MKAVKGVLIVLCFAVLVLQFQNCKSNGFDPIQTGSVSSSSTNQNSQNIAGDGASDNSNDLELPNIGNGELQAKPALTATDAVAIDCSREDASISASVADGGSDILLCLEFVLDMPVGTPRYGETYKCDENSKFVVPSSAWTYDVGAKKWSHPVVALRNHNTYVPGSYKLHVKDNRGQVAISNEIKIKRTGKTNCIVTTTTTPICTYNWQMIYPDGSVELFGGVQNTPQPAGGATCTASSVDTIVNDLNTNNPGRLKCAASCTQ